jgi:RNA polymerase sigma factor (sigma-70 family)
MSLDDLLEAVRAGEPHAERALFRKLRLELLPYFRRRGDPSDVEDLVQQTLEIVVRELVNFEPQGPRAFRSYVFTVAHNRLLTHRQRLARHRRERDEPDIWAAEPEPSPSDFTLWHEQFTLVRAALAVIKSTFRRAVESRLQEQSAREFADAEQIRLGTVRSRLQRGLDAVREQLRARRQAVREPTPTPT